jgi:hypothetical protein
MVEYNFDWLRTRGFFKKIIPLETEGKKVSVDDQNLFAYAEVSNKEELEKVKRELSFTKVMYVWFYFPAEGRLKVFRKFGEVKWFYYSPGIRSDFLKSRIDKLNRFTSENMTILFDVKDVVNRFYDQLWEMRLRMAKSILQLKDDTNKLLVAQHFIDRVIFFYFLSQLGMVKVRSSEEKDWALDRRNTRAFFDWICANLNDEGLQELLNDIFFNVLGKVGESGWSSMEFKVNDVRFSITAPSLNGGLFVEQKIEGVCETKVRMKGIKQLILEILNRYNWIIGEQLPEEEDVIGDLTPEIIGHIYEKFIVSLEQIGIGKINIKDIQATRGEVRLGRKRIGAYYTPEEITNYISTMTIYPYIVDKLEKKFGTRYKTTWEKLTEVNPSNKKEDFDSEVLKFLFFEVLENIKICDNACGSGSFLIAAGETLLDLCNRTLKVMENLLSDDEGVKLIVKEIQRSPSRNYHIVKYITTNNLYGVDIAEGAIEIAKLRFWLWLISQVKREEPKIEPLPNLDFNLITGNTLIGFIEPEEIEIGKGSYLEPIKIRGQSKLLQKSKQLGFVKGLSITEIMKEIGELKRRFKLEYDLEKRKQLRMEIERKSKPLREKLNSKLLERFKACDPHFSEQWIMKLKPFHWGFEFYEIFDLDKPKAERGFDIIIGNPPYIGFKSGEAKLRDLFSEIYDEIHNGKNDMMYYFLYRSYFLLSANARFGYIVSRYFMESDYGNKLRSFLQRSYKINQLIDFNGVRTVFQNISIDPMLVFLQKNDALGNKFQTVKVAYICSELEVQVMVDKIKQNLAKMSSEEFMDCFYCEQDRLEPEGWVLASEEERRILDKLARYAKLCSDDLSERIAEINQGIITSADDVNSANWRYLRNPKVSIGDGIFVITEEEKRHLNLNAKEKQLIKKWIKNSGIQKWIAIWENKYLIYADPSFKLADYPHIRRHLEKFRGILTKRVGKAYGWERLHRSRDLAVFESKHAKILVPYKAKTNRFAYDDDNLFTSADVYIINISDQFAKRITTLYLVGLLNSTLLEFWIKKHAKKMEEQYEYYPYMLKRIPIKIPESSDELELKFKIESLVKRIIEKLRKNIKADASNEFKELCDYVFEIYGVSSVSDKQRVERFVKKY